MRWAVLGLLSLITAGCGADDQFDSAKEAVRQTLADPNSAQFRGLMNCPNGKGATGDFNAKNASGGYNEFKPFFFEEGRLITISDSDFEPATRRCFGATSSPTADDLENAASRGINKH